MTDKTRFIMVGGFLGAGKTTTISQLAACYQAQGKNVCIVTNDQAADLVDTKLLKSYGYEVAEVAGSCFCCNFNGLTDAMDSFSENGRPDVILAEPVGSCTDLIATVAMPMMNLLGTRFEICPYAVILKPSHGMKILSGTGRGFSPKAEYIFRKQLEEADLLLINRVDELSDKEIVRLETMLEEQFPGTPICRFSAKTGDNLQQLVNLLDVPAPQRGQTMNVDYDIYAEGEAELGWLNATVVVRARHSFPLDEMLLETLESLKSELDALSAETAHLKLIGQADGNTAVANLVSSDSPTTLSLPSEFHTSHAEMVINARVAIDPAILQRLVEQSVQCMADNLGGRAEVLSIQSFRPGRPVPTHRVQL